MVFIWTVINPEYYILQMSPYLEPLRMTNGSAGIFWAERSRKH
jgi:hypothetical protein